MRFVIHATALNGDDRILALIDRLVDRIADEVHRIDVPDADLLQDSDWYRQARRTYRKVLISALGNPPRRAVDEHGPHRASIEVTDADSAQLAYKLAQTPLVVLVEDRESDGVLLEILVEELGWPALRALWLRGQEVTPRAVKIDTAGGAIPVRVDRAASDAAQENRPLRLFVLCDSDARWPGDDQNVRTLKAVREVCDKHQVPYKIWEKRCAENYIPDEVFEAVRDDLRNVSHVERFNALLRRSRLQRDHFPIKAGLSEKERGAAIETGLYDKTEEADLMLLEKRLLAKRPRPLKRLYDKHREYFTADGLRRRDGKGELDSLLLAIARKL